MRACIYARISLDKTGEELGVDRQLEDCRAMVDRLGWTLVETYIDNDISATTGKARPEYDRMLQAIRDGELDAIVAWHTDRMYRKLPDLEGLITAIDKANIVVRTVKMGEFDLSTATARMLARILASVSTAEGELKSERYRRSIRQRREAGAPPKSGPRLFGYLHDGSIVEDEARVIRWLAESLIEGEPVNELLWRLGATGIKTTLGNDWGDQTLRRLMANPRLAGHATHKGDVVGVGQWEPILDDATFQQVQASLSRRASKYVARPRVALLAGLIYCARCGAAMGSARRARRGAEAQGARVYRCLRQPGRMGCGGVTGDAVSIETIVEAYAGERLQDPKVRTELAALSASSGNRTAEIIALEDRLVELERELDSPGVPVAAITRAMDRTKQRVESLLGELALTPGTLPATGEWPESLARRVRLVRTVVDGVILRPRLRGGNTFDERRVIIVRRNGSR